MNDYKLTPAQEQVCDRLRQMKLSGMAEALEQQLTDPNADLSGFDERFENIVNYEWEMRINKKFCRFLKKATLKYPQADLDETIYEPDRLLDTTTIERLSTCGWIEEGRNLIITGATGAGKSYLANALCIAALRQFKPAKYIRANTLMNELFADSTYADACLDRIIHKAYRLELNGRNMRNPN